jgi:multisubunit Na+/H+ antiporter MnhE subunit
MYAPYWVGRRLVLLGNMLLALAWAALQADFSLASLITG